MAVLQQRQTLALNKIRWQNPWQCACVRASVCVFDAHIVRRKIIKHTHNLKPKIKLWSKLFFLPPPLTTFIMRLYAPQHANVLYINGFSHTFCRAFYLIFRIVAATQLLLSLLFSRLTIDENLCHNTHILMPFHKYLVSKVQSILMPFHVNSGTHTHASMCAAWICVSMYVCCTRYEKVFDKSK